MQVLGFAFVNGMILIRTAARSRNNVEHTWSTEEMPTKCLLNFSWMYKLSTKRAVILARNLLWMNNALRIETHPELTLIDKEDWALDVTKVPCLFARIDIRESSAGL